ncbi:hypothetical protein NH288_04680 [Anaerococcus sp. NML200537]|uniref:hypothetical protein n=1 Tax=Anaerococcus sp. NML200537 TaxID=2954485 RepID=UPI002236FA42|nr:hypothetical protein [Anaerococcus sp. NML200537]MCW6701378.1 hypothetical protein [Anaerococcus sp. NML200537]
MTEKKITPSKAKKEVNPEPKKSERLVSFREYFLGKNVRDEIKAAIKVRLKGKLYMTNEEWDKVLKEATE